MLFSIDAEKAFQTIPHALMTKPLIQVGMKGPYFTMTNAVVDKPVSNEILNRQKRKVFT